MQRKGITPVIAIVLMLGFTVGAAGSVWLYFNQVTSDPSEKLAEQEEIRKTRLDINSAFSRGEILTINVKNTGERAWNTSEFKLMYRPEGQEEALPPSLARDLSPKLFGNGSEYRVLQSSKEDVIEPYTGTGTGVGVWKMMPNDDSKFGITLYIDTSTAEEYLIFANQHGNRGSASFNLERVPSGSTVVYENDGGEFRLGQEPEGQWTWVNCCYDGGSLRLGGGWEEIRVTPTSISSGFDLGFYGKNDQRYDLSETGEIKLERAKTGKCFANDPEEKTIDPGESYSCTTAAVMPSPTSYLEFVVRMRGAEKEWSYRCNPERSGSYSC